MADALVAESLVIILASACGVALLERAGLPAVLGYLLAGWAIGPHGLQFLASSDQDLAALPFLVVAVAWQGSTEPDLLEILHQLAVAGTGLVGAAIVSRPVFRTALS